MRGFDILLLLIAKLQYNFTDTLSCLRYSQIMHGAAHGFKLCFIGKQGLYVREQALCAKLTLKQQLCAAGANVIVAGSAVFTPGKNEENARLFMEKFKTL